MGINSAVQKPPLPDRVYIPRSALQVIQTEASRHSDNQQGENETGGIMVGRRLMGINRVELLIAAATGPGESAYHNPVEFNPDVEYVNQKLKEYHALYPLMDYIGTWHKHPLTYQTFSEGDVHTAHKIFHDTAYKMDEIVNPIVWVGDGGFTIRYYYMSRAMAERGERFAEIPPTKVQEIDDNHDLVIKEQRRADAGAVPERIDDEYRRLAEQGYQVEVKQHEQEYFFTVRLPDRPDLVLHLVAPAGYPQEPPSLFVEQHGQEIAAGDVGIITQWGSGADQSFLDNVVAGVIASLAAPPLPPAAAPSNGNPPQRGDEREARVQQRRRIPFVAVVAGVGLLLAAIGLGVWWFLLA
jgi:hypothetical protein